MVKFHSCIRGNFTSLRVTLCFLCGTAPAPLFLAGWNVKRKKMYHQVTLSFSPSFSKFFNQPDFQHINGFINIEFAGNGYIHRNIGSYIFARPYSFNLFGVKDCFYNFQIILPKFIRSISAKYSVQLSAFSFQRSAKTNFAAFRQPSGFTLFRQDRSNFTSPGQVCLHPVSLNRSNFVSLGQTSSKHSGCHSIVSSFVYQNYTSGCSISFIAVKE